MGQNIMHVIEMIIVASVIVAALLHPQGFANAISSIDKFGVSETALLSTQAGRVNISV